MGVKMGFFHTFLLKGGEGGFFSRYSGTGFAGAEPVMNNCRVVNKVKARPRDGVTWRQKWLFLSPRLSFSVSPRLQFLSPCSALRFF